MAVGHARAARESSATQRLFGLLSPYRWVVAGAVVAGVLYAAFDTAVYLLLIPFVETLFVRDGATRSGTGLVQDLLDATVYRWVDLEGDPMVAIGRVILLVLVLLLFKNVFLFLRAVLVARVEQGVSRDLRGQVFAHLVTLDLGYFGRTRAGQIVSRITTEIEQPRPPASCSTRSSSWSRSRPC